MNYVSSGRVDEQGNPEFLIERTGGPTKYYNQRRRKNPDYNDSPILPPRTIQAEWYASAIAELRQERLRQQMSQMTLAQKLHTNQSVISKFEKGNTNPSLLFLLDYADALGRKVDLKIID